MERGILIITGGPLEESFARTYLEEGDWSAVIAADKGIEFCKRADILPDLLIGDFDSADPEVLSYYEYRCPERIRKHPVRKDETDTELALFAAFDMPDDPIHILGALGGRIDHMLGNIQLLLCAAARGRTCYLTDETCRIRMTDRPVVLERKSLYAPIISLIAFGRDIDGLTLKGFGYDVSDLTLSCALTRGISNYLAADQGTISFRSGNLLIIETKE